MSTILIVDDHSDIRRLIRMTLDFAGHGASVTEASDGATGLALAGWERFLALRDLVRMPENAWKF